MTLALHPNKLRMLLLFDGSATSLKVLATPTSSKKLTVIVGDAEMNPYDANNILIEDEFDIYVWVIPQKGQPKKLM